jgi:hypothetical protein
LNEGWKVADASLASHRFRLEAGTGWFAHIAPLQLRAGTGWFARIAPLQLVPGADTGWFACFALLQLGAGTSNVPAYRSTRSNTQSISGNAVVDPPGAGDDADATVSPTALTASVVVRFVRQNLFHR